MTRYETQQSERRVIAVAEVKRLMASRWAPEQGVDDHERAIFRADLMVEMFADSGEPGHVQVGDLLADLIHWCHINDVDWASAIDQAEFMFNEDRVDWGLPRAPHA